MKVLRRILFISILLPIVTSGCSGQSSKPEDFSLGLMMGRYLWSKDGRVVVMVGVHIPTAKEPNYHGPSYTAFAQMMVGKKITVRVVEKKHSSGYPAYDLVEVYADEVNINKELLKNGLAFFNEDHWNTKQKKIYQQLEAEARREKRGLWASPEALQVLFVRPKNGRFVHYPKCPHVKDLKSEERVEYYAPVPRTPFMAVRNAFFCDYCRPRFEGDLKELDEKIRVNKVKINS